MTASKNPLNRLKALLLEPKVDKQQLQMALQAATERQPAPVLWLLGKTQSGKTSLIRALTGSPDAEIGNGFQPCTRTARFYDFPAELPLVRFLDTRGLGEVAYDPAEDIRYCEGQSHLVIAVMRTADPGQQSIHEVLHAVRKRHPDWPVVIAQTTLHQCQPTEWEHPTPYPYADLGHAPADDLVRALRSQRERLGRLPGSAGVWWVPLDFTLLEDGFADPLYGLDALWAAIEEATAFGLQALLSADPAIKDAYSRAAHPHIISYALASAGLGALPLVDMAGVPAIQLKLLHTLASIYEQDWNRRNTTEFFGFLGASMVAGYGLRLAGRSLVKLVPGFGQTVGAVWGATSSGALTFALGKAACYYLGRKQKGLTVDGDHLRQVFSEALARGRDLSELRQRLGSDKRESS
ncbi:MAG: GTP-binding DUF697 domain-containing protein [Marinobacter sp.]|nr:GTP-binding DUF697 domain-containing protein [Marinobacter sp.]